MEKQQININDVYDEVCLLRDLFQRRLLDDKVKAKAIDELSSSLDGHFMRPLLRELILLLDRINTFADEHLNEQSSDFALSIYEELLLILQHYGLEQIKTAPVFDFRIQRVVGMRESEGCEDGHIVEVVRKGYEYLGSVLRPEEVIIARHVKAENDA